MTKKVLYITYDGLTDPLGQSQILPYLQQLSKSGYEFTILSFEKKVRFQKESKVVQSITNAAGITWVPLFFTAKPPVLSKIYDRKRMWRTALGLHKKKKFELVHCRSYVAAEMGLRMKQKFGVRMLFDMRGFWADEKVDNGQWNLKKTFYRYLYRFYKKKEAEFLLQADGIVSLTHAAKEHLLKSPTYHHLAIDVIPCCADLDHFNFHKVGAEEIEEKRRSLGIPPTAKVVTYLGSVGGWYMTREMFRFFALLHSRDPQYMLLILTKDDPDQVRREAAEEGVLPEQLLITYSSRKELPVYLSMCQFSLFFIRNTYSKMASSPTKHAELMGMGLPVICNNIGDTGHIIDSTGTGIIVNDFTTQTFERTVAELSSLQKMDKEYIRQHAFNLFDLQTGAERYLNVYRRMLSPKDVHVSQ